MKETRQGGEGLARKIKRGRKKKRKKRCGGADTFRERFEDGKKGF